jgi:hypothetical protein
MHCKAEPLDSEKLPESNTTVFDPVKVNRKRYKVARIGAIVGINDSQ